MGKRRRKGRRMSWERRVSDSILEEKRGTGTASAREAGVGAMLEVRSPTTRVRRSFQTPKSSESEVVGMQQPSR